MTAYGFTYFSADDYYRPAVAHTWLTELQALGARWLVVRASPARAVPEAFIHAAHTAGLQVVVDMPLPTIQPADPATLEPLLRAYARWGVRHVNVWPAPNCRTAWPAPLWERAEVATQFVHLAVPLWQAQAEAGLNPVFPALHPGGDYWDTVFLESALAVLHAGPHRHLLADMVFGMVTAPGNRPLTWGQGGPARWPYAQPYLTPPGTQDQRGFRAFEWYQASLTARLGQPRPLLSLGGGLRRHDHSDPNFPPLDETRHAACTLDLVNALADLPDTVLNVTLGALDDWFPNGQPAPAVAALKRRASQPPAPKSRPDKPLRHYVLVPQFAWGVSEWHWKTAYALVRAGGAVCGSSPAEAALAEQVTVLGNEHGLSEAVLDELRARGCQVRRAHVDPLANPE